MAITGVIFGFGRMGITHMAIFNQYASDPVKWLVVEPSRFSRLVGRLLFAGRSVRFFPSLPENTNSDIALITSPVPSHRENYRSLGNTAKKVFVEKPLNIPQEQIRDLANVLPGYVLRHNTMIIKFKQLIEQYGLESLSVSVKANTASPGADGWRFDHGYGVIEEFGSHILNLAFFLAPGDATILDSGFKSTVTAVPDVFHANMVFDDCDVTVSADWADSSARKPQYALWARLRNGYLLRTDLYELQVLDDSEEIVTRNSIAHDGTHSMYYLRGFEFSEQVRYFFAKRDFSSDLNDAIRTDQLIEEIINGSNSGG